MDIGEIVRIIFICVAIVGVGFLIWLIAEAALTVRRARVFVDSLQERIEPTLSHIEEITNSLRPAIDRIDPLMERVNLTVDSVNLELMQLDKILSDAGDITGTANGAVQKIADVANAPANLANGAANKLRGVFGKKKTEAQVNAALGTSQPEALSAGDTNEQAASIVEEWASEVAQDATEPTGDAEQQDQE